jgi:hypothetical protein
MNRLLLSLAITTTAGSLLSSDPAVAQHPGQVSSHPAPLPSSAPKTAVVQITREPAPERVDDSWAIIEWECTNPGGSLVHDGIVTYGTDPGSLSQTASSPITLNRHQERTKFRVHLRGLEPGKTYYYKVTSRESNGTSDGVESPVKQFTTLPFGQRASSRR